MADVKVYLECTCGDWKSEIKETTVSEFSSVINVLRDQAKREHPQATSIAPLKGHYLRTMVNYPDLDDDFTAIFG